MIEITSRFLPEMHPIAVHWPFTLAGLACAAVIASYRFPTRGWLREAARAATWILVAVMLVADATGFLAFALLTLPPGLNAPVWGVAGYALAGTASGTLALLAQRRSRRRAVPASSALWLLVTVVLLGIGDHAGFQLVRLHGMGTRTGYPSAQTIALPLPVITAFGALLVLTAMGLWMRQRCIPGGHRALAARLRREAARRKRPDPLRRP